MQYSLQAIDELNDNTNLPQIDASASIRIVSGNSSCDWPPLTRDGKKRTAASRLEPESR